MAKQRKEPSQKQKDYAANIARVLNIKLPEENTSAAYRDFISKNQERFAQSRPVAVHFTDEQINRANVVDIVNYARSMGLELKRDGKDYRVKDYSGGFIISPEKNNWNWFEGDQGGGVVQLCMFLENKTWQEAVGTLLNEDMEPIRRAPDWKPREEPPKEFNLPPKNNTDKHVYAYLTKTRGIDAEIVKDMLDKGYIYENQHRSCVFVGRDKEGVPRHASVRSTNTVGKAYKKDVSGSQKKYSFSISGTSGNLNVFEAPIDALSYMSLQKLQGKPVNDSYVALGGVTDKALEQYLEDHKDIRQITVCTDGDEAGEKAAERIREKYGTDYEIVRERSLHKDFNEDLVGIMQEENFKRNLHEVVAGKSRVSDSILIGKTPNILVACGAAEGLDFTVSKAVIDKCTRPEIRDADGKLTGKTGHGLTEEQLYSALMNVKEPVMVLKGNRENSLIVVTEYPDDKSRPIVVSVILDKKSGRTMINGVSNVYGRDKFEEYLERQIQADNILAFDNKKAEPLLQPIGKWYPKRGEVFSYDATIAYSMESVKKNDKTVQISEEGKKEDEGLENQINRDIDEIKRDGMALAYVKEQTPEICMAAVKQNGMALEYVEEQTPEICMAAVKQDGRALLHVKEQTPEMCLEAVKQDGWLLLYVKEQTWEICLEAVKQNGYALRSVKEQTPEICIEAVKQNGWALQYVKEQTREICLEAVKEHVWALQYVKEQTSEICQEALKQSGLALRYVKEQTPAMCMEAVKQNGWALQYVKEQTPEICMEAVKQNGLALEYVEERTPEICMAAVHQNKDAWSFVDKQIEEIMKKLDAFAETADDYEMFADKEFQERLYRTLQECKKLLQDNPDGIITLQPKFYEQSNPNELDVKPDLWNEFWSYLERYGVTGDERFSNRLNNIAAQPETKEQAFSIMKDIKEYLDNRLYMTSYMRGDVAVNEDIASYYLENAYRYLNEEFDNPDRNYEMENQIKAVQEVFSLDEAATGRFYTTNLGGTGWGMGETPYFYITEDLQSSFEAAYASYMASDEDGKTIGYSNAGMSTAQIVMLAGCYYDEGKEVHVLNKHLENQVFDEGSKVLADIEKRLYEELKQRNAETMAVQTEDFNSEVSNPALLQSERLPVAIESTADYVDPKVGFTAVATGDMPAGTKYRIVTYGENGRLVPYQENSAIYSDQTEVEAYLEEHKDRLENIDYDEMVYQAGKKIADYDLKQRQRIEEGLHSFQFDEDGYLHFSITVNDYDYDGLYRVYAPADGKNRELVSINNGQGEPFFKENWELIRQHLEQYVNAHPKIGPDGEEIPREKASVYCEQSEHDAFEEGKVYSVFEFDRLMEQADTEWIELRQQEREQYGEDAFEELYKRNLPQHQTYAKTKYTVFVPGMTELTLRQDIGDGLGGMIDFVRTTTHKHYAVPLENAFLDGLQQELDNRAMIEEQAIQLQSEMRYEEANALLETLEQNGKMNVINDTDQTFVLTGAKVSLQMQDILERLASGNEVSVEEINNTKEIRYCRSIADNGEETYLLDGREDKQKQVLQYMESIGSASGRFDENGKMLYDGEVRRDSRLDIVIGLIGAGKSSTLTDVISQEFHSKVIDNDMAKAQFIEYEDGLGAKLVHKESQEICERVLDNALERHENIVLPKVGSDANKLFDNIITSAKEHGYEINVHFVDLERDKALGRVLNRLISDGRYMDPALIYKYCPDKSYNRCERTYETLKQNELISGYSRWDNDVAKGEKPFMVESHNLTGEYIDNARLKENEKGVADNGRIGLQNNGERRQGLSADLGENGGTAEAFVRGVYEGSGKDNEGRGRELQGGVIEELEPTEQKPNDISLNDNASEKLIKLQGVYGHHKGTPAKELKIGDVLVWNYGETSEVVGMKPSKTGKTIVFQMKSTQDGEVRDRRMNAETLVVVQDKNPEADNNLQSEPDISISNYESSEPNEVKFDVNIGEEEVHKGEAAFDDDGTVNWIFVDPVPADAGEEGKEQQDTAKVLKEDWDKIVSRVKELLQDLRYKSKEFMRTIGVGNARRMYTQGTQPGASSGYSNMNRNQQSETQKASQNKNSSEQEKADNGNTKEEKTEAADRSNKNPVNDTEQYKQLIESHKQLISGSKTKRRPLVINAFGGPGSGKSTSCLDICQQLKKLNYKAEYVSEYAKDLVYDKNEKLLDGSPESQFEILKEQLKKVDRLYNSGEVDFIVTDSPILLNEIYNKSLTEEYDSMVTSLHNDFDNFTYFMERNASAFQEEGRIHNLEESQKIDKDIKQLLEDKKVRYKTYNHDTVDNIVSDAVRTFNRINGIEEAATEKQKAFAEKIAQTLNITLPEKATKAEYAAFINENNSAFLNNNAPLREQGANTGSYQDYLEMVTKDGNRLSEVPKEHYTDELLLAAVRNWGAAVRQIPEDRITAEIAMASVQQYGQNLKHVPEKLKSEEVCIAAYISSSGKSIRYTPRDMKDRVKEEGQKRLAESNSAVPNAKRQIDKEQIQQKGQEWASRIENLLKEHETDPDAMVEDIAFAGKFYQYSTRNIQLMRQQNPGITYVAKASLFNEMGYHIKDGEQAMIGRVPQFNRYIINEKGERVYSEKYTPEIKQKLKEGTLKEEQATKKFDFVAAFYDISQTDCPAEDYPSVFHMGIPSELHQDAFDAMKNFAEENLGFKVMVTDLKSISLRGSCEPDNKIIRINDRLEATMALSTLCHEIAHGIIHTSENSAKMSAAQKECETDVMDIMLETSLGLAINESRRDHLFKSFQAYKEEQASREHPYEVTLDKIIDRVQSKVFRTYIDDINICLDKYLPAEGSQNEKAAEEVVKNLAKLDYAYNMNHEALIDGKNPLFDSRRLEDYQELYRKEKDSFQLQGSFMPKLAVFHRTDDGTDYLPGGVELHEVQLLSDDTVNKILEHPEQIKPKEQPHVPVGSIVILKENILSEPHIYLVTKNEGFREITEDMKGMYEQVKNRIDCDFYVRNEYLCIHDLLENGIELEPQLMEKYNHICKEYGYSKNSVPDSGMQLMARINLITENLPQSSKDMVMEYVFRTGNFEKAERYAERIGKEPDAVRQLRQEMKLVDSYKYMLRSIAEYENNNDISEKNRLTTGAYNTSAIPVLSENVSSLSQINQKFLLIRKYASPDSVKYYSIVKDEGMEERYRIAYVELNEYEPEVVYSTAAFENYEKAEKFYDQYLHTANSRLADSSQADKLAELENRENQIALSEITSIGKTIAAEKQSYMETGLDEEGALEMLRMEIRDGYPQIKPADAGGVQQELETLKNFKKIVNSYGRERFIELSNMENLKETNVSARLWRQLAEQADALDKMNITGIDDVKQCIAAALDSSVTASDLEQALNAIDSAVLSAEFSNLETEFEGFEEYNYALDTLKAAQVTPDKFCYVDFGTEPGPYLYTSDISGNIYRKSLSSERDSSVGDLNTRLKEAGYEICSSLDDFRAYAANNRLGIFNVPEKEKNEAFIRILESTNDRLPRGQVLSVYDFKDTIDKLSAAGEFQDNITYSLVTRKDQEINSYIDTYSGNSEKNVYEQLYDKAQEKVPELSRVISRQYYQDQINSNERHLVRSLLQQMKRENKSVEDSEELGSVMDSNARLEEIIKELDLSPADSELLKLNAGNIRTEQSVDIQAQQQMNQKTQQKKLRSQQQEGMSM